MKRIYNIVAICLAAFSLISSFTACQRETIYDLDIDDPSLFKLIITPRWAEFDKLPTGMTAIVYPNDGSRPMTYVTNNIDSLVIPLPAGGYRVLLYNQTEGEFNSLKFRHMDSFNNAEIYAAEDSEHAGAYDIMPKSTFCSQPETFAVDFFTDILVTKEEINAALRRSMQIVKKLEMRPHIIVAPIYITIPVDGIYNALSAAACVDGMARHSYLSHYDTDGTDLAAYPVTGWMPHYDGISKTTGSFTAICNTLFMAGVPLRLVSAASIVNKERYVNLTKSTYYGDREEDNVPSESFPYFKPEDVRLHLKFLLADRKTVVDTTLYVGNKIEQINNDRLMLELELKDRIVLPYVQPADGSGAAGFDVTVEDWIYQNYKVIL